MTLLDAVHEPAGFAQVAGVKVWQVDLEPPPERLAALAATLSAAERARSRRYRRPTDRDRFFAGRGALRAVLGRLLELPPAAVALDVTPLGRPFVADGDGIEFSVSRSGCIGLIAATCGRRVGVDIEILRLDLPVDDLAEIVLSVREREQFGRLEPASRARAFLTAWTCKEAVLKALGQGMIYPPAAIQVALAEPRLLAIGGDECAARRWSLHTLAVADGHLAALAVEEAA
jgi:4'-phosphopantetheinyl transferase